MKKTIITLAVLTSCVSTTFSQEFSDPSRTEVKDDAGQQGSKSGFFETENPINYPAGATSWWHLLDIRHSHTVNNYAMQFAGYFWDQNLYFRKTADNASQPWSKVVMENNNGLATVPLFSANLSNGEGKNILVGDDVYIGDINESYTAGLMGSGDYTQGWLRFGKNGAGGGTKIGSDPNGNFFINNNGGVSIGTEELPSGAFEVYQKMPIGQIKGDYKTINSFSGWTLNNRFYNKHWLVRKNNGNDWGTAVWHDAISVDYSFLIPEVDTRTWWERDPNQDIQSWGSSQDTYMIIKAGNVGIGTSNPTAKLAVNGIAKANEVKVTTAAEDWPDYVFQPQYKLPKLTEIEKYIDKNGHLPNIPSAASVSKEGISLGEMNARLLEKIEELTLYMIELKKENLKLLESVKKIEKKEN